MRQRNPFTILPLRLLLPLLFITLYSLFVALFYLYQSQNYSSELKTSTLRQASSLIEHINYLMQHNERSVKMLLSFAELQHESRIFSITKSEPLNLELLTLLEEEQVSHSEFQNFLHQVNSSNEPKLLTINATTFIIAKQLQHAPNKLLLIHHDFYKTYTKGIQKLQIEFLLWYVGTIAILMIIKLILLFSFDRRLNQLMRFIRNAIKGKIDPNFTLEGNDEIAMIAKMIKSLPEQAHAIINDMQTFVAIIDAKGQIEYVNAPPLQLCQLRLDDICGKPFHQSPWWPEESQASIEQFVNTTIAGSVITQEIEIIIANNKKLWIYFHMHPLYNMEGHLTHIVAEGIDITHKKQNEAMLLQKSRQAQLGEMISIIAHQWRQPLNLINTITGSIGVDSAMGLLESTTLDASLEQIQKTTAHLSQTMDEFTSFFDPNKAPKMTSFSTIIDHVMHISKPLLDKQHVLLQTNFSNDIAFKSFEEELIQVIIDMIKNSLDFFAINRISSPKLIIEQQLHENSTSLHISDNAGGIDEASLAHIFEPYFSTKSVEMAGSGLGLYMSHLIIKEHCHGTLQAQRIEHGIMFIITLPLEQYS